MRKRLLILLAVMVPPSLVGAQDLLACISPDIRDAFFRFSPIGQSIVTSTVPAILEDLRLPVDFNFVGSKLDFFQTTVAYQTALPLEEGIDVVTDALLATGWDSRLLEQDQPPFHCRDGEALVIGGYRFDDRTFLQLTIGNEGIKPLCNE